MTKIKRLLSLALILLLPSPTSSAPTPRPPRMTETYLCGAWEVMYGSTQGWIVFYHDLTATWYLTSGVYNSRWQILDDDTVQMTDGSSSTYTLTMCKRNGPRLLGNCPNLPTMMRPLSKEAK